jgi:hypothetical protein|tara:strand:- start:221 stop:985 length:765 start_codon:yes stop_codon:yes gene_type:complete
MAETSYLEPRFRMPSIFDFVGKAAGKHLLSSPEKADEDYAMFSKFNKSPYVKDAETELVNSLFKLDQDRKGPNVFDIGREGDMDVFTFSGSEKGQWYKKRVEDIFVGDLWKASAKYSALAENDPGDAAEFLYKTRKKYLSRNPDTDEVAFKFREGLLGDVYVNPSGEFTDYWNIGLDKGEKLTSATNIKRALVAPFTSPPVVRGKFDFKGMGHLPDWQIEQMVGFYTKLFENPDHTELFAPSLRDDNEVYKDLK